MSALAGAPVAEEGAPPVVGGAVAGHFDRARGARSGGLGAWLGGKWLTLKHWLPKGQLLPEHVLRRRHRSIGILLCFTCRPVRVRRLMGNRSST